MYHPVPFYEQLRTSSSTCPDRQRTPCGANVPSSERWTSLCSAGVQDRCWGADAQAVPAPRLLAEYRRRVIGMPPPFARRVLLHGARGAGVGAWTPLTGALEKVESEMGCN